MAPQSEETPEQYQTQFADEVQHAATSGDLKLLNQVLAELQPFEAKCPRLMRMLGLPSLRESVADLRTFVSLREMD
jgi:hypothetical protein